MSTANYSRFTPLAGDLVLKTHAIGQFAAVALPQPNRRAWAAPAWCAAIRWITAPSTRRWSCATNTLARPRLGPRFDQSVRLRRSRLRPRQCRPHRQRPGLGRRRRGNADDAQCQLNVSAAWTLAPDHHPRRQLAGPHQSERGVLSATELPWKTVEEVIIHNASNVSRVFHEEGFAPRPQPVPRHSGRFYASLGRAASQPWPRSPSTPP